MTKIIIAVNIGRSVNQRPSIYDAARGYWKAVGDRQHHLLKEAEIVLGVVGNTIRGVYQVLDSELGDDDRYEWELMEVPAYAALVGHRLSPDGVYWIPGDKTAWKLMEEEEFNALVEKAKSDRIQFGPHTILLRPDGNLEIGLAPGYRADVVSEAPMANAKQRIETVVHRLGESRAVTTYQAIADMLGINAARSIARSVKRNVAITAEEGARIIPWSYKEGDDKWIVPAHEEGWSTQGDDHRPRAQILIDAGLATPHDNGDAVIKKDTVITDAATLRRYLMV